VTVVAAEQYRIVRRYRVDQLFGRQAGRTPFRLVPIASLNPFSFRSFSRLLADSMDKLIGAGGVIELHGVEL
jgi:hypothetical protein